MKMNGITGVIAFDQRGHRVNFTLDVLQLKPDGLKNVCDYCCCRYYYYYYYLFV